MKKNKENKAERKSTIKRGLKRSERLRKTRKDQALLKTIAMEERKREQKKQDAEIEKILKSRSVESGEISQRRQIPVTFSQYVNLAFWKKSLKNKREREKEEVVD